jgi:peptide/nickel transport system substrate-binding protein/oligopeptide transport system substrate-binding protein
MSSKEVTVKKPMRRWRGLAIMVAILIVAAMLLAACGSSDSSGDSSPSADGTPVAGGTYNYPLTANPVSIEPVNAQESEGIQVAHQVFQGLAKYVMNDKGEMEAVPDIAEKWETTDSQTWTFTLKKGVMYQAPVSREVKAQDFVDAWTYVTDPANQSYVSYILAPVEGCDDGGYQVDTKKGLTGLKVIDDYTLEVKLRYPFAEFPQTLGHTVAAAWPVDYAKEIGAKKFSQKPIGTGPYMVDSWKNNQSITLVKNTDYWDTSEGAGPYIDTINMPIIVSTQTVWLEFQKGSLDYSVVPPGQVAAAENNPKVKSGEWTAKRWPNLGLYFVGINMTDPELGQNAELRQAISMSTDAQNVINIVNEGVSLPATGYVPVGIPGYQAQQNPYPFDPEKAKTAVADLGTVPGLQYWYNTDEGHQKIAEVLQAGWQEAGLDVKLSNFEWGTFLDKLSKGNKDSGSQLFRMGWLADYPSMDNFLYPLFQSDQSRTGSYTFYSNSQVDDLLQKARSTQDAQQRYDLYSQAEKLILTDMPAVPLYFYRDFRVSNNRIANYVHNPMGFTDMWTLWVKGGTE